MTERNMKRRKSHFGISPYDNDPDEATDEYVCPRYEKWIKRIGHHDNGGVPLSRNNWPIKNKPKIIKRSRKRNSIRRNRSSKWDADSKGSNKIGGKKSNKRFKPLRTRSVFLKIRQKGRNFGIRCKTSVELWRKWIKRGISWDRLSTDNKPTTIQQQMISNNNETNNSQIDKDFVKKNIVNEVIPEEEEPLEENSKTINDGTKTVIQEENSNQHSTKIEINNKKKDMKRNEIINDKKKDIFHEFYDERDDKKYSDKELVAINVDNIECLEDEKNDTEEGESFDLTKIRNKKQMKPKTNNTLRRAFNKLKLFF